MGTSKDRNPYNWTANKPDHVVRRAALLDRLTREMAEGKPTHLIGARGMGKTVFLNQLGQAIDEAGQVPVLFEKRPTSYTIQKTLEILASRLAREARERQTPAAMLAQIMGAASLDVSDVLEAHRATLDPGQRLVLIFDDLDGYADDPRVGKSFFDSLESVRKSHPDQLSLMFAGSLGLVLLRSELGSSVFSRQDRVLLEPFSRTEAIELARPFEGAGRPLDPEVLDALYLSSGGIPSLLSFALHELWSLANPSSVEVAALFQRFWLKDGHRHLMGVRKAIFEPGISPVPYRVWQMVRKAGRISRQEIEALRAGAEGSDIVDNRDIFDMLRSAGLVSMTDPDGWNDDVIVAAPIPSILHLAFPEKENTLATSLRDQLVHDLVEALEDIHAMSLSYFRDEGAGDPYPEAIFASSLSLALSGRTWRCTLEPLSGAGYADLEVRHPRFGDDKAVIEVKHWPANDYKHIHAQVTSYFTKGVKAFACVMIAHHQKRDWKDEYSAACLDGQVASYMWEPTQAPLHGRFEVPDERGRVVHFLLQLARR